MFDLLPETIKIPQSLEIAFAIAGVVLVALLLWLTPIIARSTFKGIANSELGQIYRTIIRPFQKFAWVVAILVILEIGAILLKAPPLVEVLVSFSLTLATAWLASRYIKQLFDVYLLSVVFKSGAKVDELLILGKVVANIVVIVVGILIFAQTHQVNILGLIASLGIGGLAVAFAAQKTLEQVLGGIVLFLDKPFTVDDYIGLPDGQMAQMGTFGRVESIGLRSTKIRSSGKGTLIIVPNNALTQMTIENFTGGKKVMAMLYLNFKETIPEEERALIRRVILESTSNIYGIDERNTDVAFRMQKDLKKGEHTQAQITFFILGSGEVSMELRRQVLDLATQSIKNQLKAYGVAFDIEDPTVYVDSPITV